MPRLGRYCLFVMLCALMGCPAVRADSLRKEHGENELVRGRVIMTRENVVTVKLERLQPRPVPGDTVELSFSTGGETIPFGTWRVSTDHSDGTLEAEPVEALNTPSLGLDALVHATGATFDPEANSALAWAYFKGDGQPQDDRKALALFQRGCDAGLLHNCATLAWMYEHGRGVPAGMTFFAPNSRPSNAERPIQIRVGTIDPHPLGILRSTADAESISGALCLKKATPLVFALDRP